MINPATEEVIAEVPNAAAPELNAAIMSARKAFHHWAATPLKARRAVLHQLADLMGEHVPQLGELVMNEVGKTRYLAYVACLDYVRMLVEADTFA